MCWRQWYLLLLQFRDKCVHCCNLFCNTVGKSNAYSDGPLILLLSQRCILGHPFSIPIFDLEFGSSVIWLNPISVLSISLLLSSFSVLKTWHQLSPSTCSVFSKVMDCPPPLSAHFHVTLPSKAYKATYILPRTFAYTGTQARLPCGPVSVLCPFIDAMAYILFIIITPTYLS